MNCDRNSLYKNVLFLQKRAACSWKTPGVQRRANSQKLGNRCFVSSSRLLVGAHRVDVFKGQILRGGGEGVRQGLLRQQQLSEWFADTKLKARTNKTCGNVYFYMCVDFAAAQKSRRKKI